MTERSKTHLSFYKTMCRGSNSLHMLLLYVSIALRKSIVPPEADSVRMPPHPTLLQPPLKPIGVVNLILKRQNLGGVTL